MRWGRRKENGVWIARRSQFRFLFCGHDSLYLAAGWLRLRIMKPGRSVVRNQIRWGLEYIHRTYGSPAAARAHERPGWYGDGGPHG